MIKYNKESLELYIKTISTYVKAKLKEFFEDTDIKRLLDEKDFEALYDRWTFTNNYLTAVLLLANIDFLDYLEMVPDHCFLELSIEEISLPDNVHVLGFHAFADCKNLRKIDFPKNLKVIGEGALSETAIKNIYLGNTTLEDIGPIAFRGCRQLEEITLPASLKSLGSMVFADCLKLTQIAYLGTAEEWLKINKHGLWIEDNNIEVIKCSDKDIVITDRD